MDLSSLLKYIVWNHPPHFNIALMGKSVSTYVVSTNVSSSGSVCDITLGDDSIQIMFALFVPWSECIVAHILNFDTRQKEVVSFMSHCLSLREPAEAVSALWTNAESHSSARNQTGIPEVIKPMAKLLYQLSCPDHIPIYIWSLYMSFWCCMHQFALRACQYSKIFVSRQLAPTAYTNLHCMSTMGFSH